jgi:hypothetical protein
MARLPYPVRAHGCAACGLRLSLAWRHAAALNASTYLRRLPGMVMLFFAFLTQ